MLLLMVLMQDFPRPTPDLFQYLSSGHQLGEDYNRFLLTFHDDSQVELYLEALESLVNEDVLYLCCRNESDHGAREIT